MSSIREDIRVTEFRLIEMNYCLCYNPLPIETGCGVPTVTKTVPVQAFDRRLITRGLQIQRQRPGF
jgi:hypothetical protein